MKKIQSSLLLKATLALALVGTLITCQAADTTAPDGAAKAKPTVSSRANHYPIHGKLAAVDKAAGTFTIKGAEKDRVYQVNAETKITKGDGQPGTLADAVVGEDVGGYVEKLADGSVLAHSVRFGAKVTSEVKPPAAVIPAVVTPKVPAKTEANVEKAQKKVIATVPEKPMVVAAPAADTSMKTNGAVKKIKKLKASAKTGATNSVPEK